MLSTECGMWAFESRKTSAQISYVVPKYPRTGNGLCPPSSRRLSERDQLRVIQRGTKNGRSIGADGFGQAERRTGYGTRP
jgi:hypothetical protein